MINTMVKKEYINLLEQIKEEIEHHYQDKFTYALPTWAKLSGQPEIIAIINVHGDKGIAITKQPVDFPVDFANENSICTYARFLNEQMDTSLEIIGYIVFYAKNICVVKDPLYHRDLTAAQNTEIAKFNAGNNPIEISCMRFTKDFLKVDFDFTTC